MSAIWGIRVFDAITMIDEVRGSGTAMTRPIFFARSLLAAVEAIPPRKPPPKGPRIKNGALFWLAPVDAVGSGNSVAS